MRLEELFLVVFLLDFSPSTNACIRLSRFSLQLSLGDMSIVTVLDRTAELLCKMREISIQPVSRIRIPRYEVRQKYIS